MQSLILAALLAAQSPAEEPPPTAADAEATAYLQAFNTRMKQSNSARERAVIARSVAIEDAIGGPKLLREAAQAAPADPLVQMLWTTIGRNWSGCPATAPCPEQAVAWARAEPDNGLAWVAAFEADAGKSGDEGRMDAAIDGIAKSRYYDDHLIEFWRVYRSGLAAMPMPRRVVERLAAEAGPARGDYDANRAAAEGIVAMSYAAALPLPMLRLSRACSRANHPDADPARFRNCARIGRGMLGSDSAMSVRSYGRSILRASGEATGADLEAERAFAWLRDTAANQSQFPEYRQYFADLAATGSETRTMELLLARHGIPLTPPADWQPSF